jgi:hypothetical protein
MLLLSAGRSKENKQLTHSAEKLETETRDLKRSAHKLTLKCVDLFSSIDSPAGLIS